MVWIVTQPAEDEGIAFHDLFAALTNYCWIPEHIGQHHSGAETNQLNAIPADLFCKGACKGGDPGFGRAVESRRGSRSQGRTIATNIDQSACSARDHEV